VSVTAGAARPARPSATTHRGGGSGGGRAGTRALAGVVLVVVSVAVFVVLSAARDGRRQVLMLTRDVPAGQVLAAADLRSVSVSVGAGVDVVEAGRVSGVVGRPVAVPLTAGSLLAAGQLGAGRVPPVGQAVVGVAAKPGQYPPGLHPGDRVSILTLAGAAAGGGSGQGVSGDGDVRVDGLVVGVTVGEAESAGVVVSVQVADSDADAVARAAAQGRVALVARAAGS